MADEREALSGASATIASDALMNPFDGEWPHARPEPTESIWFSDSSSLQ